MPSTDKGSQLKANRSQDILFFFLAIVLPSLLMDGQPTGPSRSLASSSQGTDLAHA